MQVTQFEAAWKSITAKTKHVQTEYRSYEADSYVVEILPSVAHDRHRYGAAFKPYLHLLKFMETDEHGTPGFREVICCPLDAVIEVLAYPDKSLAAKE